MRATNYRGRDYRGPRAAVPLLALRSLLAVVALGSALGLGALVQASLHDDVTAVCAMALLACCVGAVWARDAVGRSSDDARP